MGVYQSPILRKYLFVGEDLEEKGYAVFEVLLSNTIEQTLYLLLNDDGPDHGLNPFIMN